MSSSLKISEILINARSRLGITLAAAAEETKISLRYLEALERDDYDVFPNHALALGFLRTYLEFLDLDEDSISLLFQKAVDEGIEYKKNPLKQAAGTHVRVNYESTMPHTPSRSFSFPRLSFLSSKSFITVLLSLGGIFGLFWVGQWGVSVVSSVWEKKEKVIEWDGINIWEGLAVKGEILQLESQGQVLADFHIIEVSSSLLRFKVKDQEYTLTPGEKQLLEIQETGREDISVSYENDRLLLRPLLESELLITAKTLQKRNLLFPSVPFEFSSLDLEDYQGAVYASADVKPSLNPITLSLNADSLVRYLADDGSMEEVLLRADSLLDLSFGTSLLLWVANPKAVKVTLAGQTLDLFEDAVLGIGQLIWVQTEKGAFQLRFLPL